MPVGEDSLLAREPLTPDATARLNRSRGSAVTSRCGGSVERSRRQPRCPTAPGLLTHDRIQTMRSLSAKGGTRSSFYAFRFRPARRGGGEEEPGGGRSPRSNARFRAGGPRRVGGVARRRSLAMDQRASRWCR